MPKLIFLEVPFEQKDEVKALGARWHSKRRKWYVPEELDIALFSEWIPKYETEFNLQAIAPFYLIHSFEECFKCRANSPVVTFGAAGCEFLNKDDDYFAEEGDDADIKAEPVSFSYISVIPPRLQDYIELKFADYFIDWSRTTESYYYMNHCYKCRAPLGDFFLHSEPDHAFFPQTPEDVTKMKVTELMPEGTVKLCATPHWGTFSLILEHSEIETRKVTG